MSADDYRPRTEEKLGLEECMHHDMEDRSHEGSNSAGEKHVAELRDGRVGEDFLDVVLRDANRGREQGSCGADDQQNCYRGNASGKDRVPGKRIGRRDRGDSFQGAGYTIWRLIKETDRC